MSPRWNDPTTCKFMEIYRQHECLWNSQSSTYHNKHACGLALQKIVEEMALEDFDLLEVKKKIKSLRSTYHQELAKIRRSERSGAIADHVYKPPMRWFPLMHALLKNGLKREDNSPMDGSTITVHMSELAEAKIENFSDDLDGVEHPIEHNEDHVNQSALASSSRECQETQTPKKRCIVPTKTKKPSSNLATVAATIKELKELNRSINQQDPEDECFIFGRHVSMQLKKLSTEQCIIAQEDIQKVLTRCRLNDVHNQFYTVEVNVKSDVQETSLM